MRLNAGIITQKLSETKLFYTGILEFTVKFENEFYLLLQTPNQKDCVSFLLPNHPTQADFFHKPYTGHGMYLTIEVNDVDAFHHAMEAKGVTIKVSLRDEPWGERHFAIEDPNGIGIDIVEYTTPDHPNA